MLATVLLSPLLLLFSGMYGLSNDKLDEVLM